MADTPFSGVYPVFKNQFKVGTATGSMQPIADMESFSVAFDNGIEEWTPFDTEGWVRRLKTAQSLTLSVSGKRNVGDTGNDFVAGLWMAGGRDAEAYFEWNFPDGSKVVMDQAVISVKNCGTGDSTNVAHLEFDIMSNGKPTFTPKA